MERERETIDLRWLVGEPEARFIIANGILIDLAHQSIGSSPRAPQTLSSHLFAISCVLVSCVHLWIYNFLIKKKNGFEGVFKAGTEDFISKGAAN